MDDRLLMEVPVMTMEIEKPDFTMEQCMSRPPEKVLIMPNASSSTTDRPPQRTPSVSGTKPARGRSSLLSIISGGDKKSPKSSVSSSNEDPMSPPCASPTAELTTSSSPQMLPAVSEETKSAIKPNQTKKVPPPTLAKTFKRKSSSTATTPSPTVEQPPLAAKVIDPEPLKKISETPDNIPEENTTLKSQVFKEEVSESSVNEEQTSSTTTDGTNSLPLQSNEEKIVEASNDAVDNEKKIDTADEKKEEIVALVIADTESMPTAGDASSTVDVDLPPPVPFELSPEIEDIDNVEFPLPPPPEMDFLTDINSAQSSELAKTDNLSSAQETPEATQSEDNSEITDAVTKIISKYDVSQVAVNNNNVQLHNSSVTIDADPAMSKQDSTRNELSSESEDIPSHKSIHTNADCDDHQPLASSEVDDLTASQILDKVGEQLNIELASTEEPPEITDVSDKTPNASSVISTTEQVKPTMTASVNSEENIDDSSMLTSDSDSIEHLISPPTLPPTSSFSALDTDDTPQASSDNGDGCNNSTEKHEVSTLSDLGSGDALTVAKHLDDSSGVSSTASPGTHSPPFNASSESGDSGVESGIYSLVGETVTVKLRPTINDNKKPEGTVPMFERNSSELKRVTFREATQTNPTVVNTRKTAAELERIKRTGLSEDEVSQAELFYKGHKTEVMACPCLATLYFAESYTSENIPMESWKAEHIGIPVLIYDTGNGKRSRGLTMVFAEKGTGFLQWKTVINYESRYEVVQPEFHQLRIKGELFAGIAFQDEASATSFYNYYKTCTADPEKNVLNNPNLRNGKKSKKDKKKSVKHKVAPLPNKSAISKPCEFTHVTQLKQSEDGIMASAMVPSEDKEGSEEGSVRFK